MRVLIVDSREIVRLGLKKVLTEVWPWAEVFEAADLNPAVEKIANVNYDLLLINANIGEKGELKNLIGLLLEEAKIVILTDQENIHDEMLLQLINEGVNTVVRMKDIDLIKLKQLLTNLF